MLNLQCNDAALRSTIFRSIAPDQIEQAVATVEALTRPEDDNYYDFLLGNYSTKASSSKPSQ